MKHIYATDQHRSLKRIRLYHQQPVSRVVLVYFGLLLVPVGFNLGSVYMTGTKALLAVLIIPLSLRLFCGHFGRVLLTDIMFFMHFFWVSLALCCD